MSQTQQEIERKFLVRQLPADLEQYPHATILQGYIALDPVGGGQVRLRQSDGVSWLTVKNGRGQVREETEVQLTADQFDSLWPTTAGRRLRKVRYRVPWRDVTIEIDAYQGANTGIVVAEVEFPTLSACESFQRPDWLGDDISGDPRWSNPGLAGRE